MYPVGKCDETGTERTKLPLTSLTFSELTTLLDPQLGHLGMLAVQPAENIIKTKTVIKTISFFKNYSPETIMN